MSAESVSAADWLARDRASLWHPYAPATHAGPLFMVERAQGVRLQLASGETLIDGMSSWWSAVHGYNHPRLNQAASTQLENMAHVMFGGLTHKPAIELAERLIALTPAGLSRVFLADSGSVAVEVALKMALQYWQAQGRAEKHKILALQGGYHGDTYHAMSVCDPDTGMHHLFASTLPKHVFAPRPQARFGEPVSAAEVAALEEVIKSHAHELAAFILEPIVQGAGGMWFYSAEYLQAARQLCDQYDVLLIADEIATGFGRTGKLFACEHAQIAPDILCLGKALTGGYMTLAATLCTDRVAEGVCAGEAGALMHGPTFMGNPLACAVALESLNLLAEQPTLTRVAQIETICREQLAGVAEWPEVVELRVLGAIAVIEWRTAVVMARLQPLFVKHGVWLRPFGRLVYIMPPLIIDDGDLIELCRGVIAALEEYRAGNVSGF